LGAICAWPYPLALVEALGVEVVEQRAAKGEGEAQFSMGCALVSLADGVVGGVGTPLGTAGRSAKADVGLKLCTAQLPVAHQTKARLRYP